VAAEETLLCHQCGMTPAEIKLQSKMPAQQGAALRIGVNGRQNRNSAIKHDLAMKTLEIDLFHLDR
jgi:hypothetical protein